MRLPGGRRRRRVGSLTVVGTGITGIGQITLEAMQCMQRADRLFYTVIEPSTELWLRQLNPGAESLSSLYAEGKPRRQTYAEMTERLVSAVRAGLRVCAAFYGHPGVLVESTHHAVKRLSAEGYDARMLPGVSTEDCLFADLGINPGECGLQSYEGTEFIAFRRRIDPTAGLVLWQVGVLGETTARAGVTCRPERLRVLAAKLRRHYPPAHVVVIYYAATFPGTPPTVERVPLERLPDTRIRPIATLYVPPLRRRERVDRRVVRWLTEPSYGQGNGGGEGRPAQRSRNSQRARPSSVSGSPFFKP